MSQEEGKRELQHPQASRDRETIRAIGKEGATRYGLVELARLRVRYRGFPGAKDIQESLDGLLRAWNLTEEKLFEQTREIHWQESIYHSRDDESREDWM